MLIIELFKPFRDYSLPAHLPIKVCGHQLANLRIYL